MRHHLTVSLHHLGCDVVSYPVLREELKQRDVAQVFFQVSARIQFRAVNLRHSQATAAEVPREFQESEVLLAHVIQDTHRAQILMGEPKDLAPRPSQFALQGLHSFHRKAKMSLKKLFQNIHESVRKNRQRLLFSW